MPGSDSSAESGRQDGNSTLELLHFENVRDQGIIETPNAYVMLLEIEPRDWLTLSEERRSNIYVAYMTYLRGLSYPTQILSMTVPFDSREYMDQFVRPPEIHTAGSEDPTADENTDREAATPDGGVPQAMNAVDDSPLLEYGRLTHVEWLDQMLTDAQVRDRRFFVAVGVTKADRSDGANVGLIGRVAGMIPRGGSEHDIGDEEPYLDEVWARAHRVASQLPRTKVGTTILKSREDVLGVLYHCFRGAPPPISFDHAPFTSVEEEDLLDPETGDPLDLEAAFEEADREPDPDIPERPKTEELPYEGRVAPEFVTRVNGSRLLQWYVRTIAPLGVGRNASTPVSVFGGVVTFLLALLLGVGGFLAFSASGTASSRAMYWLLREGSFVLTAGALPVFLVSLVVLLPSSRTTRGVGVLGAGIVGVAIYLFQAAYPALWDMRDVARTMEVLQVYGIGILVLVVAVGLAVRQRREALNPEDSDADAIRNEQATADD